MSHNYDNWERLVRAVLLREKLREIALNSSREPSTVTDYDDDDDDDDRSVGSSSPYLFPDHQGENIGDELLGVPMDYSDLIITHKQWKTLLPRGQDHVVWKSAFLSFSVDKRTLKNTFMVGLGAKGLEIIPRNSYDVVGCSKSRFSEVAVAGLGDIHDFLLIKGRMEVQRLSPDTFYGAYLVFTSENLSDESNFYSREESDKDYDAQTFCLFEERLESANASIVLRDKVVVDEHDLQTGESPATTVHQLSVTKLSEMNNHVVENRGGGWKEVNLGNFHVHEKQRGEVEVALTIHSPRKMIRRFMVDGFEFRPASKTKKSNFFGGLRW